MATHRRRGLIISATVASTLLLSGMVSPAQAAQSDCAGEGFYACIWEDPNFKTNGVNKGLIGFKRYIPRFETWNYQTTSINGHDTATSAKSAASFTDVYFYKNENYTGARFKLTPGQWDSDFSNGTPSGSFDNTLDSGIFADELS